MLDKKKKKKRDSDGDTEGESSQDDEVNNNIMMGCDCFRCWIRRGRSVIRTVIRRGRRRG